MTPDPQTAAPHPADPQALLALATDFHWSQDAQLHFTEASGPLVERGALDPATLIGKSLTDWLEIKAPRTFEDALDALTHHTAFRDFQCAIPLKSGATHWFALSGLPQTDARGQFAGYVGVAIDITERLGEASHYRHLAYHDALTGLPNRRLMSDRLDQAIAQGRRRGTRVAVMLLDLDHFKFINDRYGHAAGDAALIDIARRLEHTTRQSDTVARLGGDEFVVLLPQVRVAEDARVVASKIIDALAEANPPLATSVGIALYPDHGWDARTLLAQADQAMYAAKRRGGSRAEFALPAAETHAAE